MTPAPAGSALVRKSIEYSLTDHCNLSCYGCDHASPLLPPALAEAASFEADLAALRGVLHTQRLYLIGGEPLLHPRLADFMDIARRSGVCDGVFLVTNGTLLHRAPEAVWRGLAGIDVTLYPGVRVQMPLEEMQRRARRHNVALSVRRSNEFRRTILHRRIEDEALVQTIYDACRIAHDFGCHAVHDGRYYKCSVAPYTAKRLRLVGTAYQGPDDGVPLHGVADLRRRLEEYLGSDRPLPSCAYCLGTSGRRVAHHQVNAEGRKEWLREAHPASDLVDPEHLAPVRGRPAHERPPLPASSNFMVVGPAAPRGPRSWAGRLLAKWAARMEERHGS
jgi:organic radical activating enzyme